MSSAGNTLYLRPHTSRRKPSRRELEALHNRLSTSLYWFCYYPLKGLASKFFVDVKDYSDAFQLEQNVEERFGEATWNLTWWIRVDENCGPFLHWQDIFIAAAPRIYSVEQELTRKHLGIVTYDFQKALELLLLAKPETQYVTLDSGFYELYEDRAACLMPADNATEGVFRLTQNEQRPVSEYPPLEQRAFREAQAAPACLCSICVYWRERLKLQLPGTPAQP